MSSETEEIQVALGKSEALVLFDLISRLEDAKKGEVISLDNSEKRSLILLQGKLESILEEPFMKNYKNLLSDAKRKLQFLDGYDSGDVKIKI